MKVVIIFGPPGVGKGTQAEMLSQNMKIEHVSTGDILRKEIADGSELGKKVEQLMKTGNLVSDDLIIKIIERYIAESKAKGFLFDGFPRTLKQAEMLESLLEKKSITDIKIVNLVADDKELLKRLLIRAKIEGRADDNESTIKKRLEVYEKQTAPVLFYFKSIESKIMNIKGEGKVSDIQNEILKALR